jgi:3-oxoacyl-[acyl-carrier protein] reductase
LVETTEAEFDAIVALNAKGPYFAMQAAAKVLSDGGRIVNISSALTHLKFPGATAHLGSKAALEQYGKGLAQELAPRGITVNTVLPGFTDTGVLTEPVPRDGSTDRHPSNGSGFRPTWPMWWRFWSVSRHGG